MSRQENSCNYPSPPYEHGNFALHVANRGRLRSTVLEVEEDILDVVNETPGINKLSLSVHMGVAHLTVCTVLREQLYPYHLQRVQALSLQVYPA
jgi:hypothetical protein